MAATFLHILLLITPLLGVLTLACHELIGLKEVDDRERLVTAGAAVAAVSRRLLVHGGSITRDRRSPMRAKDQFSTPPREEVVG